MYTLDFDSEQRLVIATLSGFWTAPDVDRYTSDLVNLVNKVRAECPDVDVLVRAQQMPVQAKEVSDAFAAGDPAVQAALAPSRTAIVIGTVLNKMQVSRTFHTNRVRAFFDEKEARHWLSKAPGKADPASPADSAGPPPDTLQPPG